MRLLAVRPGPGFSVADVHRGWVRAFEALGVQIIDFNLDDRLGFFSSAGRLTDEGEFVRMLDDEGAARLAATGLEQACYEFQPDAMFITSCFYLFPELLDLIRARGTKVVILHTEEPYEHDRQMLRGRHADLNLINDPTFIDEWRTLGPAEYVPHAYDPTVHHPRPPMGDLLSDFCFVGTGYDSRIKFFEAVDWTGVDVALAGQWQGLAEDSPLRKFVAHDIENCVDNDEAVDLYASAKMSANLYRRESERSELVQGWACGPREIELAACGVPYLREPRGEGDELFPMLPTFESPGEFGEKLRYYLDNQPEAQHMAEQAREAVADRTFAANARRFLTLLERL